MKIAHIHRSMGTGGIEAMICGLSNEMVKKHDVTVCTIVKPSLKDKFYNELSPAVHRETIGRVGEGRPFREIVKIAQFVKKGQFDIVHIHCFFYFFVLAILLYHRKVSFCYTVHSDAFKENRSWDEKILFFKKYCFKHGWINPITISPASQSSFRKLYGCDSALIPNGVVRPIPDPHVTVNQYKITDQTNIFVHAARICPEKNQVMLCRVFDRLIREGEDVVLLIAGPVHWHDIFDEMQTFFSDRVLYIGDCSNIPELLCSTDGMCLTSFYEGFPIILLEAVAAGCIPICTAVGGIVDIVKEGIEGFLANEVSDESYYRAMKRYLSLSKDAKIRMKNNCLAKSKDYTIEHCAQEYIAYYESMRLTNNHHSGSSKLH